LDRSGPCAGQRGTGAPPDAAEDPHAIRRDRHARAAVRQAATASQRPDHRGADRHDAAATQPATGSRQARARWCGRGCGAEAGRSRHQHQRHPDQRLEPVDRHHPQGCRSGAPSRAGGFTRWATDVDRAAAAPDQRTRRQQGLGDRHLCEAGHAAYDTVLRRGPLAAVPAAVEQMWDLTATTVKMLGHMLTGSASLSNLSGPISIAQYAQTSAEMGPAWFLYFLGIISLSLGIMNLLPIPILDGGH